MSTTVISESEAMNAAAAAQTVAAKLAPPPTEVDFAKCDCCGLTEECTLAYIETIRARYQGKWLCGLCAEAVKDEMMRCHQSLANAEEALTRHLNFCKKFSSSGPPPNPTVHLIAAMRQLLRKSLDSPKSLRSMPCSPTKTSSREMKHNVLVRAESCIPTMSLVDSAAYHAMEMDQSCE